MVHIKGLILKVASLSDLKRRKNGPLIFQVRPALYTQVLAAHLPFVLIAGLILVLPKLVSYTSGIWPSCLFLKFTGYPCPFCGLTRSFLALAQGSWSGIWSSYPLTFLLYVGSGLVFSWHAAGLAVGVKIEPGRLFRFLAGGPGRGVKLLAAVFLLNWVYRLVKGLG